jgi:3-isopropylmalate/(R)-2-methylmalate dehydratase large subunit
MTAKTLYEKIWDNHVVYEEPGKPSLLYIDRHLIRRYIAAGIFRPSRRRPQSAPSGLDLRGYGPFGPHKRSHASDHRSGRQGAVRCTGKNCKESGVRLFDANSKNQGIVHIIGPELGITQPGQITVCGDSHTSTHGAFGTLAFGIRTSQVAHVLATQCLVQGESKTLHILVHGKRPRGVTAKDIILAIIGKIGIGGGTGHVAEYGGQAIRELSMDGRMTVCNMTIEGGARA